MLIISIALQDSHLWSVSGWSMMHSAKVQYKNATFESEMAAASKKMKMFKILISWDLTLSVKGKN